MRRSSAATIVTTAIAFIHPESPPLRNCGAALLFRPFLTHPTPPHLSHHATLIPTTLFAPLVAACYNPRFHWRLC